ncbi:hypothetical protein THRCLA_22001 [Thraustotheca clavata]|uniref:Uncharacterized protein n=1 Tax=Thraustotheca clavata TaxID=74557 RepID=A0A1V9ZER9_9STRA|nr:hypothetical protein THRCLA_22001 [Thraustotheca clavata]
MAYDGMKYGDTRRIKRREASPYLDVMTVQSRRYISNIPEDDHAKLLVEPIHIPDLNHTGIRLDAVKVPLFYPNGSKNVHFRQVIQESLAVQESLSRVQSLPSMAQHKQVLNASQSTTALSPKKKKTSRKNSEHLYVHRDKATAQHYKEKDSKTRDILATVRMNTTKITNLVNPHAT